MTRLPAVSRRRYARETAAARKLAAKAAVRANQAATWAMFCYVALAVSLVASFRLGQRADQIQADVLTVAKLLQRQTQILLERVPAERQIEELAPLDLPAAIAEGA